MKNCRLVAWILLCALLAGCGSAPASVSSSRAPLEGLVVLVDAGHGDTDVGTVGISGRYEKEVNIEIALKLQAALEAEGAVVRMTRIDDSPLGSAGAEEDLALRKEADWLYREQFVEQAGADMVLSIHQNSFDDPAVAGPQVFYLQNADTGEERGEALAEALQASLNSAVSKSRSIGTGNWRLLKPGNQPGCIVECGFFSNAEEEALLQTPDYQDKLVEALVSGVKTYVGQYGI